MDQDLVDRIYESSLVSELWPGVLDELARLVEAPGGTLFIAKGELRYWTASPIIRDRAGRMMNEGWLWRGQLLTRAVAARHAGFLTEVDLFTPEELDQEPIYRDFWRPQARRTERGPVERAFVQKLDELRPHLARSALLSARLQLERARIASETLAALGLPALVLNDQGKVLAANSLIEALSGYVQWRAQDRVSLKDKAAVARRNCGHRRCGRQRALLSGPRYQR